MIRARGLRVDLPEGPKESVSLDISEGEIVGLMDPQGGCASWLLGVLAGLRQAEARELRVGGVDALCSPTSLRDFVGYLSPDLDVCLGESIREDLGLVAALRSVDPRVIDGVIELMDLGAVCDRGFDTLSRAQKLRLGLARLLLHDPSVILLDEPFAHLDPLGRDELADQLAELSRMGKTVIFHTQCTERFEGLCHRVISLDASGLRALRSLEGP